MATRRGLEPLAFAVTGRRDTLLHQRAKWWCFAQDSNLYYTRFELAVSAVGLPKHIPKLMGQGLINYNVNTKQSHLIPDVCLLYKGTLSVCELLYYRPFQHSPQLLLETVHTFFNYQYLKNSCRISLSVLDPTTVATGLSQHYCVWFSYATLLTTMSLHSPLANESHTLGFLSSLRPCSPCLHTEVTNGWPMPLEMVGLGRFELPSPP